jgi:acetyl-CoA C-acetyltransferase
VTAGNASSINDGAAALVLMSADEAKKRGAKVLAKLVSWGYHAQAPEWFTTAPAGAIKNALERAKWDAKKVDLWEINEAFAVVSVANNQMVGLDPAKVNIWGGAVALGHPIGASGARVLVTLVHQMAAKNAKTGGASLCIGGGEGIALLVERP